MITNKSSQPSIQPDTGLVLYMNQQAYGATDLIILIILFIKGLKRDNEGFGILWFSSAKQGYLDHLL